jgi:dihydroorotase
VPVAGHPRFFLGSDSAPHPRHLKECATSCAGVFTSPLILPYLATLFERRGCLARLPAFVGEYGARFYRLPLQQARVVLVRQPQIVPVCGPGGNPPT